MDPGAVARSLPDVSHDGWQGPAWAQWLWQVTRRLQAAAPGFAEPQPGSLPVAGTCVPRGGWWGGAWG